MIKALILDADGVVINKQRSFSHKFTGEYDVPMDKLLEFFKNDFAPCTLGQADLKTVISPYLRQWNWPGSTDEFLSYWFEAEHFVDEELVGTLPYLKIMGVQRFLASNQEQYRAAYIAKKMQLEKYFDRLFFSHQFGYAKPQQEFWKAVYANMDGISKQEILFWDDSEENVKSAKSFGIMAEVYTTFDDYSKKMEEYLS